MHPTSQDGITYTSSNTIARTVAYFKPQHARKTLLTVLHLHAKQESTVKAQVILRPCPETGASGSCLFVTPA